MGDYEGMFGRSWPTADKRFKRFLNRYS